MPGESLVRNFVFFQALLILRSYIITLLHNRYLDTVQFSEHLNPTKHNITGP